MSLFEFSRYDIIISNNRVAGSFDPNSYAGNQAAFLDASVLLMENGDSSEAIRGLTQPKHGFKRFVTFNICGIKNVLEFYPWNHNKSLAGMFDYLKADIITFQETKLQSRDLKQSHAIVPGFTSYFTFATSKKGYSGVAVYVRNSVHVIKAEEGITGWANELGTSTCYRDSNNSIGHYPDVSAAEGRAIDAEGRAVVLELYGDVVVISLYCPANSQGTKLEYRMEFFKLLNQRIEMLVSAQKKVVVMGDLNVTLIPRDSAEAMQLLIKSGKILASTDPKNIPESINESWRTETVARRAVHNWITNLELVDTTREMHPNRERMFTCWNQLLNMRPANYGSRIDFILADKTLLVNKADILPDLMGSDHCPVFADLAIPHSDSAAKPTIPALSRKRCQGFGQDIKSMFAARSGPMRPTAGLPVSLPVPLQATGVQKLGAKPKSGQKKLTTFMARPNGPTGVVIANEAQLLAPEAKEESMGDSGLTPQAPPTLPKSTGARPSSSEWSKIFTLKKPLCFHEEECVLQVTKKAGPNKGRSFWSCQRAQGAEGDQNFRCKFFKWA